MTTQLWRNQKSSWFLLGIVLLGLALRWYHIDFQNLWLDEAVTWRDSQLPLPQLLRQEARDVHPPGVYLFVRLWEPLSGANPALLRLPFAICSLSIVVLTFLFVRRTQSDTVALMASLLLAISPHQIYFAHEVRMYTLATALTLGGAISYIRIHDHVRTNPAGVFEAIPGHCIGFVLLFAAALHMHYFTSFMLATVGLHAVVSWRRSGHPIGALIVPAVLLGAVALLYVPWLWYFLQHRGGNPFVDWRRVITMADVPFELGTLFRQFLLGPSVHARELADAFDNVSRYPVDGRVLTAFLRVLLIFVAGTPVAVVCFLRGAAWLRRRAGVTLFLFVGPVAMALLVMAAAQRQMELSRYLMMASPYFMIIVAAGLLSLTGARRAAASATVVLAMALSLAAYYGDPSRDSDYRPVVAAMSASYQPGDVVVPDPPYMDRVLLFYCAHLGNPPFCSSILNQETESLLSRLDETSPRRVWYVLDYRSSSFGLDPRTPFGDFPAYDLEAETYFPQQFPKIRLLQLGRHR